MFFQEFVWNIRACFFNRSVEGNDRSTVQLQNFPENFHFSVTLVTHLLSALLTSPFARLLVFFCLSRLCVSCLRSLELRAQARAQPTTRSKRSFFLSLSQPNDNRFHRPSTKAPIWVAHKASPQTTCNKKNKIKMLIGKSNRSNKEGVSSRTCRVSRSLPDTNTRTHSHLHSHLHSLSLTLSRAFTQHLCPQTAQRTKEGVE